MSVPFLDLGAAYEELAPELDEAYRAVMRSGRFLMGEQLEAFEAEFAAHSDAAHCAGVGSGFDALALGLRALGVEPGDEVLVPANGSATTWLAVASIGAVPVAVEPLEATHTIDPDRLEAARGPRTRALVPVHLYGRPADMAPILGWAREHGVRVLADAAQAHGARIDGAGIGAVGDAVAWSFYPSKNLGGFADGGALTSDDPETIARLRRLRNYGFAKPRRGGRGRCQQPPRRAPGGIPPRAARPPRRLERPSRRHRPSLSRRARRAAAGAPTRRRHHPGGLAPVRHQGRRPGPGAGGPRRPRDRDPGPLPDSAVRPAGAGRARRAERAPSRSPNGWRPRCSASLSAPTSGTTARLRWWRRCGAVLSR